MNRSPVAVSHREWWVLQQGGRGKESVHAAKCAEQKRGWDRGGERKQAGRGAGEGRGVPPPVRCCHEIRERRCEGGEQ